MGYDTYVSGSYRVEPELPFQVIKSLEMHDDGDSDLVCGGGGEPDTVGIVDGQIAVIPGNSWTEVTCRVEEPYKAYDLGDRVTALVEAARKAGCTVNGALYLDGEDSGDFSRIRVEGDVIHHESPEFVWPNGDRGWGS